MCRPERGSGRTAGGFALLAGGVILVFAGFLSPCVAKDAGLSEIVPSLPATVSGVGIGPAGDLEITGGAPRGARVIKLAAGGRQVYGPEQRAQELYLDGLEKLEAGRRQWAQKTFESLVARYPESGAARLARRQLADLYRDSALPAAGVPAARPEAHTRPRLEPVAAAPAAARLPDWDFEARQRTAIQTKLRAEAGDRIFFSSGSAELGSRARSALAAQARWLNRSREFEAAIEGHADEPGSEEDNRRLSERRANAVRERLIEEGVEAGRLAIIVLGRSQRVAACQVAECRAQNRRAVTVVLVKGTRGGFERGVGAKRTRPGKPQARAIGPARPVSVPASFNWIGVAR